MKRAPVLVAVGFVALPLALGLGWLLVERREAPAADEVDAPPARSASSEKEARLLARVKLSEAEQALREGKLDESRAAATEALALAPELTDALRLLAVVETRAGRGREACRLMSDYVRRAATPEPARARLLASACAVDAPP